MFVDLSREGGAPRVRVTAFSGRYRTARAICAMVMARDPGSALGCAIRKTPHRDPRAFYRASRAVRTSTRRQPEISVLAEASIEVGLAEAVRYAEARWGPPITASGAPSTFVVIGMGKLGGRELNAGSDIDVLYLYDTDEGMAVPRDGRDPITLHEYWSRVARRLTANLDATTPEGTVWRVDLRLRPEGSQPHRELTARRRTLLRDVRPTQGASRSPASAPVAVTSIWASSARRALAIHLRAASILSSRSSSSSSASARTELCSDPERDLKLGPGGIREVELFVQALQLIWGGKEPRVRATGTLEALKRLRGEGLVTDREERAVESAYLLFRRLEHRIQWATGLQTHALPVDPVDEMRLARSLGYPNDRGLAA
jgi:glutamate-ammonia-ligase adenylyltransferase